jgi:hypothetical protein
MASKWATCGAALLLGLAVGSNARAGDKLSVYLEDAASIPANGITGGNGQTTVELDDESDEATEFVAFRGGGGRGWGGGGWGGRGWGGRGFGWGWGGRGWGWGGRGWGWAGAGWGRGWGWGWGRGWGWGWGGWGWGGWGWGGPAFVGPSFYYYNPCPTPYSFYYSYSPLTVDVATSPPTAVASSQIRGNSATYAYNGGPNRPVPYPQGGPDMGPSPRMNPPDAFEVVTPQAKKHSYPAYGESPTRTTAAR